MDILQELEQFIDNGEEGDNDELNFIIATAKKMLDSGAGWEEVETQLAKRFGDEYLYEPQEGEELSIIDKVKQNLGV